MPTSVATTPSQHVVRISRKQVLSLFGVVPLGVYVVLHLWTSLQSLNGPAAFNQAVLDSRHAAGNAYSHPAFVFLEIFGLGIPLLVHTVFGLREIFRARPNNFHYNTFDNLKYVLQRLSAVGLALFIGAHVWKARLFPEVVQDGHESWMGMHEGLSEPLTFAVYLLGILGISYHLANGLSTAASRWGLSVSPAGRARMQWVSGLTFVLLLAMGYAAIWGFRPFQSV